MMEPLATDNCPWKADMEHALGDFIEVARLAGYSLAPDDLRVEYCGAPHRQPARLPVGSMALYAFHGPDGWLKIGIAGQQSQARFTSQHYNAGSAPSTLAASLCRDLAMANSTDFSPECAGDWIRTNCHRVNVLLDAKRGRSLLALLEAFLHARLKPRYER